MPRGVGGDTVTRRLLIASTNAHKVAEIRELLAPLGFEVTTHHALSPIEETGATFAENARLKALAAARDGACWALADDSGLVVPALDGAPGVRSARFAGPYATDEENNRLLIERLTALGLKEAPAAFVCALCVATPEGHCVAEVEGRVSGLIRWPGVGENGFGYDPLFFHPPSRCRFSELSRTAKNAVSHRGAALKALVSKLVPTTDARTGA